MPNIIGIEETIKLMYPIRAKSGSLSMFTAQKLNPNKKIFSETRLKQIAIFIFVAIPLPMTGVWMGTAIAVFLGLKFKESILPLALGNLVAGLIIALLAELLAAIWTIKALDYILYGLFALAILMLIVLIIKVALSKPNKKEDE